MKGSYWYMYTEHQALALKFGIHTEAFSDYSSTYPLSSKDQWNVSVQ